jgi:hypothetical protein
MEKPLQPLQPKKDGLWGSEKHVFFAKVSRNFDAWKRKTLEPSIP